MGKRARCGAARAVLALAIIGGGLSIVELAPAGAVGPAIIVEPTTAPDGGTVHVTTSGFELPGQAASVGVCDRAWAEAGSYANAADHCTSSSVTPGAMPAELDIVVRDYNRSVTGVWFRCSDLPAGCVIGAATVVQGSGGYVPVQFAWAPIAITPPSLQVRVSDTDVASGTEVTVTVQGFPAGPGVIAMCPDASTAEHVDTCGTLLELPGGLPPTTSVRVPGYFLSSGVHHTCVVRCMLAAYTTEPGGTTPTAFGTEAIRVAAPVLAVTPQRGLPADGAVELEATGVRPGSALVAQCRWTQERYDEVSCATATPIPIDATWRGTLTLPVHEPLTTASGEQQSCDLQCVVGLFTPDGQQLRFEPISFGPPRMLLWNPGPYRDGDGVSVYVTGFPGAEATVALCALPLTSSLATSRCDRSAVAVQQLDGAGTNPMSEPLVVRRSFVVDGATVDCLTASCAVVAFAADGTPLASEPIELVPPPTMLLSPSSGLTDGETIQVQLVGLFPQQLVRLQHCAAASTTAPVRCQPQHTFALADTDGRASSTVIARQRLDLVTGNRYVYCRAQCTIRAIDDSSGEVVAEATYAMSTPTVSASPATGLTDGATVTVTGAGLQPTYTGPTVLFPTGGWAVVQCDAAVGTDPGIVQVFQQCAVAPGGAAVPVPGSASSTDVAVRGTITKILGGTTDCTAAPGACVVGLARWEQDGTTTSAFTPISFG